MREQDTSESGGRRLDLGLVYWGLAKAVSKVRGDRRWFQEGSAVAECQPWKRAADLRPFLSFSKHHLFALSKEIAGNARLCNARQSAFSWFEGVKLKSNY